MTVSITLQFSDIGAAARAMFVLNRDQAEAAPATEIAHADRPDIGASVAEPVTPVLTPAVALATAVFGGAAAPAAPTVPAPPLTLQPALTLHTVATVPTAAPGVERDATGLIWDARIHASTKSTVASGAWTAKRGVDPAFKAQIEADLRGVAAPAPAAAPVAAPAAPPAPPAAPAFQAPVAPAAPPAPAAAQAGEGFAQYMARIGLAFTNRPLDAHNLMGAALAPHGLQHVGQLAGRPDLIPDVDAEFQRLLAA